MHGRFDGIFAGRILWFDAQLYLCVSDLRAIGGVRVFADPALSALSLEVDRTIWFADDDVGRDPRNIESGTRDKKREEDRNVAANVCRAVEFHIPALRELVEELLMPSHPELGGESLR